MKLLHLTVALVCLGSQANATPYFRIINPAHPQPVVGAMIDPQDLGQSEAASLLPLITHSTRDGCIFPSIICEDWTPLAVGASMNAGKITLNVAPLANVLPWVRLGVSAITPDSWASVHRMLSENPDQSVTFSAGPVWQYRQETNKGYFKVFTGLALHF